MDSIRGVPAPIPHSKLAGPDKYRLNGSGAGSRLAAEPVNQPLVKLAVTADVARMSPTERQEYLRSVGQQATARAVAKVVDILA